MQQYRVNFPLLIGLLVGTLVSSGAVYALWSFQIKRNSGTLLARAEQALQNQDYRRAVQSYTQYLAIQPDDEESRIKYAHAYADLTELDDVRIEELGFALRAIEGTVRALPQTHELRRRLAEFYARVQRIPDALQHVNLLLESDPDNPELQVLRTQYMIRAGDFDEAVRYSYTLIGYDPDEDEFDTQTATAAHEPQIYASLASVLRTRQNEPELADRVINQMVQVNPDSASAYLHRGRYFTANDQPEKGKADIAKAYELDAEDADVLLSMAGVAAEEKEFDEARQYLEAGKQLYPQDIRFYQSRASVEYQDEKYDEALAQIDEGLEAVEGSRAQVLLVSKSDLQFRKSDLEGVEQTIRAMEESQFRPEYIEFVKARVKLAQEKWFEASEELVRIRPRLLDSELPAQIDLYLALCYERLGRWELARRAYDSVLEQFPENEVALAGVQKMNDRLGLAQTASARTRPSRDGDQPPATAWQQFLADELAKPREDQNWPEIVRRYKEIAAEQGIDEADQKIFEARLAIVREDFDAARERLREADELSPQNMQVGQLYVELLLRDPRAGADRALQFLDRLVQRFGDVPALRLQRAQVLIAAGGEDLQAQLSDLTTGLDPEWTEEQNFQLWGGMAQIYLNQGMHEEASRCLALAADLQPNNLPIRQSLFSLALQQNDDEGMKAAQDRILQIVRSKNDSAWLFTEAQRQLSLVRRGRLEHDALPEIRTLIDRALSEREEWNELYLLSADLELLAGNFRLALQHFDKAAALGRGNPNAVAQHIRLLIGVRGDFNRAKDLLDRIPENVRQQLLGALYTEILFRTDEVDNAIAKARAAAEANENNPQHHYWLGQLLARSAQSPGKSDAQRKAVLDEAIGAMRRSVELQPDFADGWYSLITLNILNGRPAEAHTALRDAQLVLSGDNLTFFLAKGYEALGRWFDAETMYRAVYEADPDDMARTRQLAEFYLGNVYRQPDKLARATPLINKILRAGADDVLTPNDPNVQWARRMGARMLAGSGDYQQLLKAENLLASNAQDGALTLDDKLEMARILSPRPEPLSRLKAAQLLEEVAQVQPLDAAHELILGRLYYQRGDWRDARTHMRSMITRFAEVPEVRETYIRMLLDRGDRREIEEAASQLERLRQIAPNRPSTFELAVRVASRTGREREARGDLVRVLPSLTQIDELTPQHVQMLELLASLFIDLDDLDNAEKIYRFLVERDPQRRLSTGQEARYVLALFLGRHRDVEQSFDLLSQLYNREQAGNVLPVAIDVVRHRRDDVGEEFDSQVQAWLDRALLDNPEAIALMMAQADFYDVQQRYEDAKEVYRKLLERSDLIGLRRAIVLNNFSYLVALAGLTSGGDVDPLKLVDEAAGILGPTADILDTRAVVRIALGQPRPAIHDLELAVTDNPTPSKFFHKAQAHLLAGENKAALESWQRAEELGLTRETLNRLEHERYDELKKQIEALRATSGSVTQVEPRRRAG